MVFARYFLFNALYMKFVRATWLQVGNTISQAMVLGVAIDYNETNGFPIIAYGYSNNSDAGATTISFSTVAAASNSWTTIATHTPEFGQTYDEFSLRVRHGLMYLGLRITEAGDGGLSSVLRGRGGWDGFDGCYAFQGWVYDWDVAPMNGSSPVQGSGDMRLVVSPDNATVATAGYGAAGWDQYPANDTWSRTVNVSTGASGPVLEVVTATGCAGLLFAGWVQAGNAGVAWTQADPASSTVWELVPGASFPSALGLGLSYSPWGVHEPDCAVGALCASWYTPAGGINVSCAFTGAGGAFSPGGMMAALSGVRGDADLTSGIAIIPLTASTSVLAVAGLSASDPKQLLTAYCVVNQDSSGSVACRTPWVASSVMASDAINNFQLKPSPFWPSAVGAAPAIHAIVSSGPVDGSGDEITVWKLEGTG